MGKCVVSVVSVVRCLKLLFFLAYDTCWHLSSTTLTSVVLVRGRVYWPLCRDDHSDRIRLLATQCRSLDGREHVRPASRRHGHGQVCSGASSCRTHAALAGYVAAGAAPAGT